MKIVGIHSSARGKSSNTLKLLNAALPGAADGIILSSPNYITNITAQLKILAADKIADR